MRRTLLIALALTLTCCVAKLNPHSKIPAPKQGMVAAVINFTTKETVWKLCKSNKVAGCTYMDGVLTVIILNKDSLCLPELLLHEVMHSDSQHGDWHANTTVSECTR